MSFNFKSESKFSVQRPKTSATLTRKELSKATIQPLTPLDVFLNKSSPDTIAPSLYEYFQKFNVVKSKAIKAIREGKIFVLVGYWPVVRRELQNRGWVEKIIDSPSLSETTPSHQVLLKYTEDGNEFERRILSNLVADYPADFVFSAGRTAVLRYVHDFALWNRINIGRPKDFTLKDGLCRCLEDSYFTTIENKAELNVPRAFVVENGIGLHEFRDEYHLTMCRSLVGFLNENVEKCLIVVENVKDDTNVVESSLFTLVCDFLHQTIQIQTDHIDLEESFVPIIIEPSTWSKLTQVYVDIIEKDYKIVVTSKDDAQKLEKKIHETAKAVHNHWLNAKHDGYRNIWIVKPSNQCGGTGVLLFDKYEQMIAHAKRTSVNCRTILQKYIERPLLIHNNKFDIRYFFMTVTDLTNVKLWEYQMCYLRFASTEFNLKDISQQIHVTNHTLQKNFKNGNRSDKLPPHNMWHVAEFQEYLTSIGHENIWNDKIYPAIKRNLIGLVVSSLEEIEYKAKRFQIYGADFLITDDFDVYLLECNHSPALATNTTVVTEVVFKKVLEDALKVVLDYSNDIGASTGQFQLIFKTDVPRCKPAVHGLNVDGQQMIPTFSSSNKRRSSTAFLPSNNLFTENVRTRSSKLPTFIQHAAERERARENLMKSLTPVVNPVSVDPKSKTSNRQKSKVQKTSKHQKANVKNDTISIPLCHPIVKQAN